MKYELPCGIVKDLLPSYIDNLTSDESSAAVKSHLDICDNCRNEYLQMSENFGSNNITVNETELLKKSKKKLGKKIFKSSLIAALSVAVLIPLAMLSIRFINHSISSKRIAQDLEYYNMKAINNLDSLIGCDKENVEDWIEAVFHEDNLKKAKVENEGAYPAYINTYRNIKIFFILEDNDMRFFIEPYSGSADDIYISADEQYLKKVDDYCADKNADYKNPPAICELCLYNFDKGNEETELVYNYLFNKDNSWGYYGDEGPYNSASFTYVNNTFVKSDF